MKFDIDIKLRFSVDGRAEHYLTPEKLVAQVSQILMDWCDGRYPFSVELLRKGAGDVVCKAVENVVVHSMFKVHGKVMVTSSDGKSATAKAVIEADKVLRDVSVRLVNEREEVACVRTVPEQPSTWKEES